MESTTCTAAVVTPYPKHVSQAQLRADSRPQSSRRPSPHPPQPPSHALPCLSRDFPQCATALYHANSRQSLTNAHTTLVNAHPSLVHAAQRPHPENPIIRQILVQFRHAHANSRQTLTNAHERSYNTRIRSPISRPCRPAAASRKSDNPPNPGSVQTCSRKLSSITHERSYNTRKRSSIAGPCSPAPAS